MKKPFRIYPRTNVYYLQNSRGEQRSLGTRDKTVADKIRDAENQARETPRLNLEFAKVFSRHSHPESERQTWQVVIDELATAEPPEPAAASLDTVLDSVTLKG
jgi:hypothetical protein